MNNDHLKYEDALMGILHCEGEIVAFLDVIFGFLYRRTDFYKIKHETTEKIGFLPGVPEKLVHSVFNKYLQLSLKNEHKKQNEKTAVLSKDNNSQEKKIKNPVQPANTRTFSEMTEEDFQNVAESYNGAIREKYTWSQTLKDLDVRIKIPETITSSKKVKVGITHNNLNISIQKDDAWETLVDGKLKYRIRAEDSMWTLLKGEHIFLNLEKAEERFWDALCEDEPTINMQKIDNSQPFEELDDETKTKLSELMYNEQQKRLGKPTSDQQKIQSVLKDAWDKEGSPFKGTPYDPSIVNIGNPDNINLDQFKSE